MENFPEWAIEGASLYHMGSKMWKCNYNRWKSASPSNIRRTLEWKSTHPDYKFDLHAYRLKQKDGTYWVSEKLI